MHFFNLICLMDRREQCMSDYMSEWGCHVGASYELTVDEGLLLLQITNIYIEYNITHLSFKKTDWAANSQWSGSWPTPREKIYAA